MKFGETLATLLTPEWRTQYIEYEALKSQLYQAQEEAPSAEVVGEEARLDVRTTRQSHFHLPFGLRSFVKPGVKCSDEST